MAQYAEIAVDVTLRRTFDYHIPPSLQDKIAVGHLVEVQFATANQPGIVVRLHDDEPNFTTKPILARLHPQPVVNTAQIALGRWMSARYQCALSACLWLMLPPSAGRDVLIHLRQPDSVRHDPTEQQVIDVLKRRSARNRETRYGNLTQALPGVLWRQALDDLERDAIIERERLLIPPQVSPKIEHIVSFSLPLAQTDELMSTLPKRKSAGRWYTLWPTVRELLLEAGDPPPVAWLCEQSGMKPDDIKKLVTLGVLQIDQRELTRDTLAQRAYTPTLAPTLTNDQQRAWAVLSAAIATAPTLDPWRTGDAAFLLHGITGSGKTELYLHAIDQTLDSGRQAIFLVPEIALTPQTIQRVMSRFPLRRVAVLHGNITPAERYDTWRRALAGQIDIVIGARSALFAPLPALGLVILDEEHDSSYKQSNANDFLSINDFFYSNLPDYHAREVALELMRQNKGIVILGSATPDIETRYRAQQGELGYLPLSERIVSGMNISTVGTLPSVQVVDMREELKSGNVGMFSAALHSALGETLARGEQAILFLNRRGQNTYVFCRDCGYVAACSRCDTPMTYHKHDGIMRCHICNHRAKPPTTCPICKSARIKYFGAGTQQVQETVAAAFPSARVIRWDADTVLQTAEGHEGILDVFRQREADILVGTQMIAKGHDLPMVTLVGIVSADLGLALPDFRSGERAFQLLTQVAGRGGRGERGGRVVLQTYQPNHYAVMYAARHDYEGFYARELAYRRELGYPPYRRMVRIVIRNSVDLKAKQEAERAANTLRAVIDKLKMTGTEIIGPAPCFQHRMNRAFRWHVILRGPDPIAAIAALDIGRGWVVDVDPTEVL
jgi:primosomal protein N' (replication factor Y) (superfamily II helicase)